MKSDYYSLAVPSLGPIQRPDVTGMWEALSHTHFYVSIVNHLSEGLLNLCGDTERLVQYHIGSRPPPNAVHTVELFTGSCVNPSV